MFGKIHATLLAVLLILPSSCAPITQTVAATETGRATEHSAPGETPEPIHIKVGVLNFMSNSPLFIAQEDGYFIEQGLEVELVNFGTSDRDMIPALLQGQLDVGATTVSTATLNAIFQGNGVRYVADKGFIDPEAACAADGWVVRKSILAANGLDSPSGPKGLKFTFSPGNTFEYVTDLLLESAELSRQDIEILDIRDQALRLESLRSGTLDITPISEPWITRAIKAEAGELWLPLSEVIPDFSVGTLLYGPSMLERDPQVGVRFMIAYLNAIEQYNQGKTDRNVEIIAGFTELSPEEILEICWPSFKPDGKILAQGLMDFSQWALAKDYLDGSLTIDQMWDPQYVDEANAILNK